jgi:hypothetical protein
MSQSASLSTVEILATFRETIVGLGGRVADTFDDGRRLFTRSVLALADDVRPGDRLKGGVALRATEQEVWVHPYLFRQVCRNGAIVAQALETRYVADLQLYDDDEARHVIRQGVEECSAEEVFAEGVQQMRSAAASQVELALMMLPLMARISGLNGANLSAEIIERFFREGDRSRFGLVQAITSVARDNIDPDVRWNLEELGGAVAAGIIPEPSPQFGGAMAGRQGQSALVGSA